MQTYIACTDFKWGSRWVPTKHILQDAIGLTSKINVYFYMWKISESVGVTHWIIVSN